jgi:hypothetical protein
MMLGSRTTVLVAAAAAAVSDGCLSLMKLLTAGAWCACWSSASSSTLQLDSSKLCLGTTAHKEMCTSAVDGSVCNVVQAHSHTRRRMQARQVSQPTTSEEAAVWWWTKDAYETGAATRVDKAQQRRRQQGHVQRRCCQTEM